MNPSVILYSFLYFALFLFLGFGLTVLLCPKGLLKYTLFLSPLIGYCFLTFTGFYFFNFKGTNDYYYWILLFSLLFLIAAAFKIWKQKILTKLFSRELIIPIVIAIIVFFVIAIPSLRQERMTSMALGNNDIAQYASGSEIGQQFPRNSEYFRIYPHWNPMVYLGPYIGNAFFCSVVHLEPYQVQMITLYIFFIISLLLTYILSRELFKYTGLASNVIIVLLGLNSMLYYVIYQGFEPQTIAVGLALLIILANVTFVRANKFRDAICYLPFLFLALWGIIQTYPHMLIIIYALIIFYVLISWWRDKKVAKLLNWAAMNGIAALLIIGFSPQIPRAIVSSVSYMGTVVAGWFMPWSTPQEIYGVIPILSQGTALRPDTLAVTVIISVILIVLIVAGFVKLYRSDKENFLFASTTLPLIFIGAIILSLWNISKASGGFGGYNQFKLISFFLPIILLSSFGLFGDMTFNKHEIRGTLKNAVNSSRDFLKINKKSLYIIIIAVVLIANCLSTGVMLHRIIRNATVLPADAIDLLTVRSNDEIQSVNIPADGGAVWNIMWEAYFLYPKKLFFEQTTYYLATPLDGEWSLIRNTGGGTEKVLSVLPKTDPNTIQINSTYALIKGAPRLTAKFGEGWADNEETHRWTTR